MQGYIIASQQLVLKICWQNTSRGKASPRELLRSLSCWNTIQIGQVMSGTLAKQIVLASNPLMKSLWKTWDTSRSKSRSKRPTWWNPNTIMPNSVFTKLNNTLRRSKEGPRPRGVRRYLELLEFWRTISQRLGWSLRVMWRSRTTSDFCTHSLRRTQLAIRRAPWLRSRPRGPSLPQRVPDIWLKPANRRIASLLIQDWSSPNHANSWSHLFLMVWLLRAPRSRRICRLQKGFRSYISSSRNQPLRLLEE